MPIHINDLPMDLRAPCLRRMLEQQQQQLDYFAKLKTTMEPLWNHCCAIRTRLKSRSRLPMVGEQFQQVVDECENGILTFIPQEHHGAIWKDALVFARQHTATLGVNPEIAHIALAEISLRELLRLALIVARDLYPADHLLPAWREAIHAAQADIEQVVEAWKKK